jgi:opacity protein-like surface antigen
MKFSLSAKQTLTRPTDLIHAQRYKLRSSNVRLTNSELNMRNITKTLIPAFALFAVLSATHASAQDAGPYLRGALGTTLQSDVSVRGTAPSTVRGSAKTKAALSADLAIGYDFANGFRLEGAYSRINGDLRSGRNLVGKAPLNAFMVNGFYDFNHEGQIQPYLGVGVGLTNVNAKSLRLVDPAVQLTGNKQVAAWQFMGGIGYQVNDNLVIDGGIRVLQSGHAKIRAAGSDFRLKREATTLQVGVRYKF